MCLFSLQDILKLHREAWFLQGLIYTFGTSLHTIVTLLYSCRSMWRNSENALNSPTPFPRQQDPKSISWVFTVYMANLKSVKKQGATQRKVRDPDPRWVGSWCYLSITEQWKVIACKEVQVMCKILVPLPICFLSLFYDFRTLLFLLLGFVLQTTNRVFDIAETLKSKLLRQ